MDEEEQNASLEDTGDAQDTQRKQVEEEWAKKEGIPRMDDQFMQKYFQGRDALIAQEKKQRSDHSFREFLSPLAQEACAIVSQIRFEEQQTIWRTIVEETEIKSVKGEMFPGMMFALAKEHMEKTKMFKIIKKMPKGALLHCHLEAMLDLTELIGIALETEGMHMCASQALSTSEARQDSTFSFRYFKNPQSPDLDIWKEGYSPNAFVPLKAAAESFPDGGSAGFKAWFKSRLALDPARTLRHDEGENSIWRVFVSAFDILKTLIYYEPIYRKYLRLLFHQLKEDGIQWIEIRTTFIHEYFKEGSETPSDGYLDHLAAFDEELDNFQNSPAGKTFWGARLIWTAIRSFKSKSIVENMKQCIEVKESYPDLISGFDLAGQEDLGQSLAELTPELFWFRKRCAEAGVNIPFFFHAGETLGDGNEVDENLFDAILLGTRRIGHGFSLYKHPLLMNMVKEKKILIESCPISNEVLRLTTSILSHPLPALLAQGVPAALSNDDPALLGQDTCGVTHDFYQALQGWENLGLEGLGSLAENSVRWAAYDDYTNADWVQDIKDGAYGTGVRAKRLKEWKSSWESFAAWIVLEFGVDLDTLDEQD